MMLSIIFTSALATMAIASPVTDKRVASRKSSSLLDAILNTLSLPNIPNNPDIDDLHQCLSYHKTFHTDFTKADDGTASITNLNHTCCAMARSIWDDAFEDLQFHASFTKSCDGVTLYDVPKMIMEEIRRFIDSA